MRALVEAELVKAFKRLTTLELFYYALEIRVEYPQGNKETRRNFLKAELAKLSDKQLLDLYEMRDY